MATFGKWNMTKVEAWRIVEREFGTIDENLFWWAMPCFPNDYSENDINALYKMERYRRDICNAPV